MPKFFLALSDDIGQISCSDKKPEGFLAKTHKGVFDGLVTIWCAPSISVKKLEEAGRLFAVRTGRKELFRDVQSAVEQLAAKYDRDGTGYIALGGSPKIVKWLLKKRGFNVVTVNVSAVPSEGAASAEFTTYLTRKLDKLGAMAKLVVLDYADTGASLVKIKADVKAIRPSAHVTAVAVGKSPTYSNGDISRSGQIDVLTGVPTLQKDLHEQRLKFYILGRNKIKNPYATWSAETGARLDDSLMAKKSDGTNTSFYQNQKADFAKVIDLPLLEVSVDIADFLEDSVEDAVEQADPQSDSEEYVWS